MRSRIAPHTIVFLAMAIPLVVLCVRIEARSAGRARFPHALPTANWYQAAPASAVYRATIPGSVVAFEMVAVPGGTVAVEGKPVIVAPCYIGRTEVTWDMYDVFALGLDAQKQSGTAQRPDSIARPSQPYGAADRGWGHAGYPAIGVTRAAAEAFCEWLSAKTGKRYRLPAEAEWMRAAELALRNRDSAENRNAIAWHRANANGTTHPVGAKRADSLGLFDLLGNVSEWVRTGDDTPVTRGGSFRDDIDAAGPPARAVQDESWNARDPQLPKSRWWLSDAPFVGFRLASDN